MLVYENVKNEFEEEMNELWRIAKKSGYNIPIQFVALENIYNELSEQKQKEYKEAFMIIYRSLAI